MKKVFLFFVVCLLFLTSPAVLSAQINIKEKIKTEAKNKINQKVNESLNPNKNKEEVKKEDEQGDKEKDNEKEKEKSGQSELQTYSKFDFIPGEKVIFFEDFSQDKVGDFPALWNTNVSAEVMTTNFYPGQWMKLTSDQSAVWNDFPLDLPENYTIEFDIIPQKRDDNAVTAHFRLIASEKPKSYDTGSRPGKAGFSCDFEYATYFGAYFSDGRDYLSGSKDNLRQKEGQKYHISVWVQKERIRVYQDETKIFDLPKAIDKNVKYNKIRFEGGQPLISNIRVAVGAPDMRSKLLTEGKLVTYGIYFDVNKDVVKPESYGTLKEIAQVLKDNPEVRVKIVGHTDSDGSDEMNLDLSKRRGAGVKKELVKTFGIEESRLESDGMGESQPIAPNDTPANKALNRRVEFIKL